jgi:hypothetical protein
LDLSRRWGTNRLRWSWRQRILPIGSCEYRQKFGSSNQEEAGCQDLQSGPFCTRNQQFSDGNKQMLRLPPLLRTRLPISHICENGMLMRALNSCQKVVGSQNIMPASNAMCEMVKLYFGWTPTNSTLLAFIV